MTANSHCYRHELKLSEQIDNNDDDDDDDDDGTQST